MNELAIRPPDGGGGGGFNIPGLTGTLAPPLGIPTGGTGNVQKIIQFGVTSLLIASTLLCLFFLIYGGIKWITSGGDKAGVESARKILTYAIIGLVIVFLSFFILNLIGNIFGVDFFPYHISN